MSPREEYESRLGLRAEETARVERLYGTLSNLRLLVFGLFLVSLWLVFGSPKWPLWVASLPPAAFLALFIFHEFVAQKLVRAQRAVRYYELAIARLDDRWVGVGPEGREYASPRHPYAIDLDLFGPGSLFQRLSLARTRFGERTLAGWLLAPADPAEIRARQEAGDELRPELDLRESIALEGEELELRGDPDAFVRWAETPPAVSGALLRVAVYGLVALALVSLVGALRLGWGWSPFVISLMAQLGLRLRFQRRLDASTADLEDAHGELQLLATVLGRFEQQPVRCGWLTRVRDRLESEGQPPSVWIRRLGRLFDVFEAKRNSLFAPISFVLMLDFIVGFALDDWRTRVGGKARAWLDALGDLEAISSLAGYAYERPTDVFATVRGAAEGAAVSFLEAESIGHPLLPGDACVHNDVRLGGSTGPDLLVVSGSNMSGKSTFLRTLGIGVVLAQAGAPVRCRRIELSPLRVGASIRVMDSIQEGVSHFYAEVKRLRQIVERTEEGSDVLFLVDEILQGTNSHDRRIGVEAVMQTLVDRGAVGVITTHDLALTEMVGRLRGRAENVHFQDELEDGRMRFDYRLRRGVVSKSNALELMRSVGLDVGPRASEDA
ncbi:MAG: DNA mismatch repair protein MutS [Candidatus Eisenbacteria bacterium]